MPNYELAFIGAGNMAEAIARGILAAKLLRADQIIATDPSAARRELFESLGLSIGTDNAGAARSANRLLLAVKPQTMSAVLAELAPVMSEGSPETLVISIAAGISTSKIESELGGTGSLPASVPQASTGRQAASATQALPRVVRVMPNTPMLAGCGMSALVKGSAATDADLAWARRLFDAGGKTIVLQDERLMDAVTAVSGSGPAYFFYLIEQMVAAGVDEGLSESDALTLAAQTCLGSAKLLAESSGIGPRDLRRRVTSPHGTTQAATDLLDARGVAESIRAAIRAAAARSRDLGAH